MSLARVTGGVIRLDGGTWQVCIGRGGIRGDKQEGDGATPIGVLPLRRVFYRADRGPAPRSAVPVEPLAPDDGWCDDPADRRYNTRVRLPCDAGHEALWRTDSVYDLIGVLGWNDDPIERGRGSAIFIHVAAPDRRPTEGCVALAEPELRTLLAAGLTGIRVEPA